MDRTDDTDPVMIEFEQRQALEAWAAEIKKLEATPEAETRLLQVHARMVKAFSGPKTRALLNQILDAVINRTKVKEE